MFRFIFAHRLVNLARFSFISASRLPVLAQYAKSIRKSVFLDLRRILSSAADAEDREECA